VRIGLFQNPSDNERCRWEENSSILKVKQSNRGKIEILADILNVSTSGIRKTHIMYKANLSYDQVNMYLAELIQRGFIVRDATDEGVLYRTTEGGRELLDFYNKMVDFLKKPELSISA
jgi:predicted transcriptional regulator